MKRLMIIKYRETKDVEQLHTCLDMCCIKHVIFNDGEFTDGTHDYKIYIDRGNHTWLQVMTEVNRVHAVKFNYENNVYIKYGELYRC